MGKELLISDRSVTEKAPIGRIEAGWNKWEAQGAVHQGGVSCYIP